MMVTKEQILKYWFEEKETYLIYNGQPKISDFCIKLYFRITNKYGRDFVINHNGPKTIINNYLGYEVEESKETYEAQIKLIREELEKENPILILEANYYTLVYIFENYIVALNIYDKTTCCFDVYTDDEKIAIMWYERTIWQKHNRLENNYYYAAKYGDNIKNIKLEFKKFKTDIERNYNDDVPLDKIINFLKSDSSGLILFHGEPGTGKTSFLKHIISTEIDKKFIIIPKEIFNIAGQQEFVNFFLNNKDCIFILEDCEKILMKRENGASLETILNMSDGILGSTFKTKFICTFNTDLENIDEALLRKGRLNVRYEFKKLSLEKTRLHLPNANEEMTLAEIYNPEDNGAKRSKRKKVGY